MSDWIGLPDNLNPEEHYAIVYRITNIITNKKYIGKKQLFTVKKLPPLKKTNLKRKRKVTVTTDYLDYYGSSENLKNDVANYGKENFKREVLSICKSKFEVAYAELEWQIKENVLFRDDYYNGIIQVRLSKPGKEFLDRKRKEFNIDP